jgi:hypothetical protein
MSEMEIEKDMKVTAFKELTNINSPAYYLRTKDVEMTPSSIGKR